MSLDFFKNYEHKLKNKSQIIKLIGSYPRAKKVILCHGVFDVVHPGHVRHLAYAKSKADILIASVTEDKFINKGAYRPHIPEKIRALNLAAFEMVDYVFIDDQATPINSLELIKPDYFAKGFEYTNNSLPPATLDEKAVVEKYGGQMLFTPGDVVYSSSKFIDLFAPRVELEKLSLLMDSDKLHFSDLRNIVNNLNKHSVHVVGDTIVDTYTRTTLIGGQTKTPTFSVLKDQEDDYIGGAAIVARHLAAAGAKVYFSTVLGDDSYKDFVLNGLKKSNIVTLPIIDKTRPTTNKNVFISSGYRLLKVDTLDNRPIFQNDINEISEQIKNTNAQAVVFSDFRHGIFSEQSISQFITSIPKNLFSVADSQVASRWGNILDFKGFDLITPNEREARFALADQDATVGSLSGKICSLSKCKLLFMKLGEKGLLINKSKTKNERSYFSIDSFASHVSDAVGAGDALLAYSTLSLMENKSEVAAAIIGSIAAACECECDGNIPITPEKVLRKLDSIEKRMNYE